MKLWVTAVFWGPYTELNLGQVLEPQSLGFPEVFIIITSNKCADIDLSTFLMCLL